MLSVWLRGIQASSGIGACGTRAVQLTKGKNKIKQATLMCGKLRLKEQQKGNKHTQSESWAHYTKKEKIIWPGQT